MLETICTPYGKVAFPTVVKCDGCGRAIIDNGWLGYGIDEHYCDKCYCDGKAGGRADEFRICTHCGKPMIDGMTDLNTFYAHEECFEGAMGSTFPDGWRQVEDDGCDGYYEWFDRWEGKWRGTGIFYTTWY